MTLLQIRYFQAVCTYDGISIAAEKLNVSQPTISTAIKQLEQEFGVLLFDRVGKRLQLTEAGVLFSNLCNNIIADVDGTANAMKSMSGQKKEIYLGIEPALAAIILPSLYKQFNTYYPNSSLYVEENDASILIDRLNHQKLDMIVTRKYPAYEERLRKITLALLEYVVCVSTHHPFAESDTINSTELDGIPLIAFPLELPPNSIPNEIIESYGGKANIIYRSNQLSTIRRMIIGNGMCHFTYRVLAEHWKNIHVCALEPRNYQPICLYWLKGSYLSPSDHNLIDCLKSIFANENFSTDL